MSINHNLHHPGFCDPRCCTTDRDNVDHRSSPMSWKVAADDYLVTTGLARLDGGGPFPHTGRTLARLDLLDLASDNLDGSRRTLGTDLTATDARLLAAALVTVAEQLEQVTR
ncbi:hypothetical protein [Pseudonocardia nigra]|uniref:hypothetical protein n=1 Tax=Pseudonocardia nigra TaxID=1921578 RepID=UPI001C5E7F37|nr:hypothetical protein [Pseudonocardia nigra]